MAPKMTVIATVRKTFWHVERAHDSYYTGVLDLDHAFWSLEAAYDQLYEWLDANDPGFRKWLAAKRHSALARRHLGRVLLKGARARRGR